LKFLDSVRNSLGINAERFAPLPRHQLITDGLLFTETAVEAWFKVGVQNLDTAPEIVWDGSLDRVKKAMKNAVGERDCMLRVMWTEHSGEEYVGSVRDRYAPDWGRGIDWAETYGRKVDELMLPSRIIMLGVKLGTRNNTAKRLMSRAEAATGHNPDPVSDAEMAKWMSQARKMSKVLAASPLAVELATAESIAWMLSRESGRAKAKIPARGTVRGAALGHLLTSKMVPFPDHVQLLDEHGDPVLWKAILPVVSVPEELSAPGNADWPEMISRITKIEEISTNYGYEAVTVPVRPDVTVRFNMMGKPTSRKEVNDARKSAKEQRRSAAKGSAEEPPEDVIDSEAANAQLLTEINKPGGTFLVHQSMRVIVTGTSREELEDNIDAVTAALADEDYTLARGENEQRDLWLENFPGDTRRVTDLSHIQTDNGFFGSFFWGGSRCGDERGGMTGFVHGATVELFRSSVVSAGERGDTTSILYAGRSGRGKTTAMMLEILSDMMERPSWCALFDWKGDTGGAAAVAQHFGIPASVVELGAAHSGAADLFRSLPLEDAPDAVQSMLMLQAKEPHLAAIAPSASLRYALEEAENSPTPSTWGVIQRMAKSEDPRVQQFAAYLSDLAKTPIGRIVMGKPTGEVGFTSDPGLRIVQAAGLSIPSAEIPLTEWDGKQRLSVALIQGITGVALRMSSSKALRSMRKAVAVPEVHILLRATGGANFLDQVARMGRAYNTSLLYDTQDCTSIAANPGLVEQLHGVRLFQFISKEQQNAGAELLGLAPSPELQARILELALDETDSRKVAKGRALVRDWTGQVAEVQFTFPSDEVQRLLSTDPNAEEMKEK
jgi:SLV.15